MTSESNYCDTIVPLLDCYHDGEADDNERQIVEAHLSGCESCRNEMTKISSLVHTLHALPAVISEIDFSERLEKLIRTGADKPKELPRSAFVTSATPTTSAISRAPVAAAIWISMAAALVLLIMFAGQILSTNNVRIGANQSEKLLKESPASHFAKTPMPHIKVAEIDESTDNNQKQNLVAISDTEQNNISEELGLTTDEDGLYAIKM